MKKVILFLFSLITLSVFTSCADGLYLYGESSYVTSVPYYYSGLGVREYYHIEHRPRIIVHNTQPHVIHKQQPKPQTNHRPSGIQPNHSNSHRGERTQPMQQQHRQDLNRRR